MGINKIFTFIFSILAVNIFGHFGISGYCFAAPVLWVTNGHYYEIIRDNSLDWFQARDNAASAMYNGWNGHLATITSQDEFDFLSSSSFLGDSVGLYGDLIWLGGYQTRDETWDYSGIKYEVNSGEKTAFINYYNGSGTLTEYFNAAKSQWHWITGEDWSLFNLWDTYTPNNGASTGLVGPQVFEDFLSMHKNWWSLNVTDSRSDARATGSGMRAYIIEYEPDAAPVPIPSTVILFSTGLMGIFGLYKKR